MHSSSAGTSSSLTCSLCINFWFLSLNPLCADSRWLWWRNFWNLGCLWRHTNDLQSRLNDLIINLVLCEKVSFFVIIKNSNLQCELIIGGFVVIVVHSVFFAGCVQSFIFVLVLQICETHSQNRKQQSLPLKIVENCVSGVAFFMWESLCLFWVQSPLISRCLSFDLKWHSLH